PFEPRGATFWWCAQVLCGSSETGVGAWDIDTGRPLWWFDGWRAAVPIDRTRLLVTRFPSNGGAASSPTGAMVVDVATGRVARRVAGWEPITTGPPDRLIAVRHIGTTGALVATLDI